ncbi:MAG: hypothetical protein HFG34_08360 [Eubacterium sp.]|nr:hypothetical protein [Eubacterium sp.]
MKWTRSKVLGIFLMLFVLCGVMANKENVQAKVVKKLTMAVGDLKTYSYRKAKKIKITVNKKGIVSAKNSKKFSYKNLQIRPQKAGKVRITTKVTLKGRKRQTYVYDVTVRDERYYEKQAWEKQNQYRIEAGVDSLEWSDELYQLAKYRAETSGFDKHKNMERDIVDFFSKKNKNSTIFVLHIRENLHTGTYVGAMSNWRASPDHYRTMINSDWKSGAVYYDGKGCQVAMFSSLTVAEMKTAGDKQNTSELRVKRKDTATDTFLTGSQFTIVKVSDGSMVCSIGISVSKTECKTLKLVPGETYKIYEVITPTGYKKAKSLIFTVKPLSEGVTYITMSD